MEIPEIGMNAVHLWDLKSDLPLVREATKLADPTTGASLYKHKKINEEKSGFYTLDRGNYFALKFRQDKEKQRSWGVYRSDKYSILIKPLEKPLFWSARHLLQTCYFSSDPLWSWYDYEKDEQAYHDLMRLIKSWLEGGISVCAYNKTKKRVDGLALGQKNSGLFGSKKYFQYESFAEKPMKVLKLRGFLLKRALNQRELIDRSVYQVFLTCVNPRLRKKFQITEALARGTIRCAWEMKCQWAVAVTTTDEQRKAYELAKYQKVLTMPLNSWLDGSQYSGSHSSVACLKFRMPQGGGEKWVLQNRFHLKKEIEQTHQPEIEVEDEEVIFENFPGHNRWLLS